MHFNPAFDVDAILKEHVAWAREFADPLTARHIPHENDRSPERALRIGFVSPDVYQHAVGRFLLPLLENRDREQFKIVCYSGVAFPDALTERARSLCDEW